LARWRSGEWTRLRGAAFPGCYDGFQPALHGPDTFRNDGRSDRETHSSTPPDDQPDE
jgi:hypothetical protein